MGNMIFFSRRPILVSVALALFFLLTFWALLKPGWKRVSGEEYTIKYPSNWYATVLDKSIGGEKFLLTINNTKQIFDSSGYRTDSTEVVRIILKRLNPNQKPLEKINTQIGGYGAYSTSAVSSGEIYRKEIRYKISGPGNLYLLEAYVFEKENLVKSFWYEFLVRNIAQSLTLSP